LPPSDPENMSPVFETDNLIDAGKAKIVGNNHLKLEVVQLDVRSEPISSIAFQQGTEDLYEYVRNGNLFSICLPYRRKRMEWKEILPAQYQGYQTSIPDKS